MENHLEKCPCGSEKSYCDCCEPFHLGKGVPATIQHVRARFSAYALNKPSYIIATTHPASPLYVVNQQVWAGKISEFSRSVTFKKVEILAEKEWGAVATVVFSAHLVERDQDVSFTEKSFFEKKNGKWLYRSGLVQEGHAPNFLTINETRVLPIACYGEPVLRKKALPVEEVTEELRVLVSEMIETMDAFDGAGLAAPQVHHSIRLFVMRVPEEPHADPARVGKVKVFINPKLSSPSEEMVKGTEGCLSIPTSRGDVRRPKEITVEYTDLEGNKVTERLRAWEARVIMHETDHLNGILYIDRMEPREKSKLDPLLQRLEDRVHDQDKPL